MNDVRSLLLVDDDEDNHTFAKRRAGAEWVVESALSGEEALARLASLTPALILVDLNMPAMSGLEFISHVRSKPEFAGTPIRVVTAGDPPPEVKAKLRSFGVALFDKGKLSSRELPETLRAVLAGAC